MGQKVATFAAPKRRSRPCREIFARYCSLLLTRAGSVVHLVCMNPNPTLGGLAPLIGIEELAEYLDLPVKTLYKWRQEGVGPASVRVGRHVRYFVSDVQDWLLDQRTSTQAEAR